MPRKWSVLGPGSNLRTTRIWHRRQARGYDDSTDTDRLKSWMMPRRRGPESCPMSDVQTSQQILLALRAADARNDALVSAYQRYFFRMVALIRKRLPGYLQNKADPSDLAQSAWGSFIDGLARNELDLDG